MTNPQALSPLWTGNFTLDNFNAALGTPNVVSNKVLPDQKFWASPARPADDPLSDVMEVSLATPRLINFVSLSLSNYPLTLTIQYYDVDSATWLDVQNADGSGTLSAAILDSSPAVIPAPSNIPLHYHPQHSFSGHWKSVQLSVQPFTVQSLRFILKRNPNGRVPVNPFGTKVDYSVAAKDVVLGYQVADLTDIPGTDPMVGSFSEYEPFATTTDALGSTSKYSLRIDRASNALVNQSGNVTDSALVWKSDPQPIPWAVVNFYMDLRDAGGTAQLIDRFYVDPLYEGPNLNLYWSNDDPSSSFAALRDPLLPTQVSLYDQRGITTPNVLHAGGANLGYTAYVDVNNTSVDFSVNREWWIGGQFNTKFAQASSVTVHPILDLGEISVALAPAGLRITTDFGDNLLIPVPAFDPAMPFTFIVSGDGTSVTGWVKVNNQVYTAEMALTVFLHDGLSTLRFGGFQGANPGVADMDFTLFTVKIDDELTDAVAQSFLNDPVPYVITQDDRTDNALLRYHYTFSNANYRSGFIGGFPDRYKGLNWSPVTRDFVLRKGFLNIPPTKAKYWKFEFCGLVPEAHDVFKPIRRAVKTYPFSLWDTALGSPTLYDTLNTLFPGMLSAMGLGTGSLFSTATTAIGTGGTSSNPTKTATMARVIWDSASRALVGGAYWVWNFLPLHQPTKVPRFPAAQQHVYETFEIDHTIKLGYFVGLKDIQAFRLNYLSIEDTDQYVELFNDLTNVNGNDGNWLLTQEHMLTSGSAEYAEITSQVLPSSRVVRAVQFATQQSVAKQLLLDDDFNDPTHSNWAPLGDATLTPGVTTNNVLGTTVKIDRSPQKQSWSQVELTVGTWAAINTLLFGSIENAVVASHIAGGITSIAVGTPVGGRVYAAARVMAPVDLSSPLQLQIVDDSTGNVLSEGQIDVKANQVTEWFTGFTIGDITSSRPFLWRDFYGTPLGPYLLDKFQRANANTLTSLDSGQLWSNALDGSGNALSLHISSSKAVVTTEGQFNFIDSQYPWGTLEIVVGTMGSSASSEIKLIDFDPLYIDDQGLLNFDGGSATTTATSVIGRAVLANDDIRIDIMPTLAVPAGKTDPAADPVLTPYSIVVYLNGIWIKTVSHARGARTIRGIKGRLGQQFTSFSWKPTAYGQVTRGTTIVYQPRVERGTLMGTQFLDNEGNTWTMGGNWDISTAVELANTDNCGLPLSASLNGSAAVVDVGYWYGSLHAYVRHVAGTSSAQLMTVNPSFESGTTGWLPWNSSTIAAHSGGSSGANSIQVTSTTAVSSSGIVMDPANKIPVTPGTRYIFVFDVNPLGVAFPTPRPFMQWYDSSNTLISQDVLQQTGYPADSNWHTGWATFLAPPTAATVQVGLSSSMVPIGQTFLYDNFRFMSVDTGAKHGNVLCIDYDNGIYVRYDGNIVDTNGIVYGNLFPSGIPDNSSVSLHFVRTAQLLSGNQGGYSPTQYPDMIVAKLNGTIVGRFVGNYLSVWRGTRRGLAGDTYDNGVGFRPAAIQSAFVNNPSYGLDTSFRAVNWAPDASNIAATPSAPTWDNVSDRGLATWSSITATGSAITRPRLRAQLQQHGQTADTWEVDTLSLYVDPILWYFSNDGGTTFFPALDIRNNPNGVMTFPVSQVATSLTQKQGNALVWKAVAFAPECTVSSLVIRPWYGSLLSGVTHFVGILNGDPNVMPYDHYPDIRNDARFQTWNSPIPEDWWHRFRVLQQAGSTAPLTSASLYPGDDTFPGPNTFPG